MEQFHNRGTIPLPDDTDSQIKSPMPNVSPPFKTLATWVQVTPTRP